jgi:hypothetical protein
VHVYIKTEELEAACSENHKEAPEVRNNSVKSLSFNTDLIERYLLVKIMSIESYQSLVGRTV